MSRYPGKDIFYISTEVFGKIAGKVVIALFVWYAFHLGSLILRNFSEFIQVTAFNEMPQTFSLLCLMCLIIWAVKGGVETLGRWSAIMLPVLIVIVAATVALMAKDMHLINLLPVGENLQEVPKDVFNDFSFPYAETVLFLGVLNTLKGGGKPGKAWVYGILIGGAVLLFGGLLRNLLVLGMPLEGDMYFPSYGAVSIIIAGSFISRIENAVGANLVIAGFVKISVCLIVASKGMARLVDADDYRPYVAPLGLLMVALACIVYKNIMDMLDFLPVYFYYAFPFQVIIPLGLCIAAEVKLIIKNKKEQGGAAPAPAQ
jgi:spore germination protein KB